MALFAFATLEAWTTAAVLFIFLERVPFRGGLRENAYYAARSIPPNGKG